MRQTCGFESERFRTAYIKMRCMRHPREILRTGVDLDHLHPPCSADQTANCLPSPFDGNLLQIMPWYAFQSMTERDIRAIYEYLSAVPCIEGPPAPSVLH